MLEPTTNARRELRRYKSGPEDGDKCPGQFGYHNAAVFLDIVPKDSDDATRELTTDDLRAHFTGWPNKCDGCDYHFEDSDHWQLFTQTLWARADTGEQMTLDAAPPGAMYHASWFVEHQDEHDGCHEWAGPDGLSLWVKCPNGRLWGIDSRASNCDSKCKTCGGPYSAHYKGQDYHCKTFVESRPHKCWVRHGEPPMLTVDKNGLTCGAGAGSIQAGDYHGFLRNGQFTNG
jgi:hypothetical protein